MRIAVATALVGVSVAMVGAAVTACSADDDAASSTAPTTIASPPASPTASTPQHLRLTRSGASQALASLTDPQGYSVTLRCPPAPGEPSDPVCRQTPGSGVSWSATVAWSGGALTGAQGLGASLVVNVVSHRDQSTAGDAFRAADARLGEKVGDYDVPIQRTGTSYTPGERGTGSRSSLSVDTWTGDQVDTKYVVVFDDDTESGPLATSTAQLHQGSYRLEITWTTNAKDGGSQLEDVVRRVVEALSIDQEEQ